jgi:hypothetical protein
MDQDKTPEVTPEVTPEFGWRWAERRIRVYRVRQKIAAKKVLLLGIAPRSNL